MSKQPKNDIEMEISLIGEWLIAFWKKYNHIIVAVSLIVLGILFIYLNVGR